MVVKIKEYLLEDKEEADAKLLLEQLFYNEELGNNSTPFDREWLGKLFTALENAKSNPHKKIWEKFCNWFLLECIDNNHGALNTLTTDAAEAVWRFSRKCNALCFSANFDNYLLFNFAKAGKAKNKLLHGMSIYSRSAAEQYFKRTLKNPEEGKIDANNCVFHSNGDVFWLNCSGDATDGYCPKKDIYLPAFSWFKNKEGKISKDDLVCDICTSKLHATMTMPGTYKKDHDTREMVGAIWKFMAPRISTVITVGISCNWDDVLLKFITGLLYENDIPHLDINDGKLEKRAIYEKIVCDKYFSSVSIISDANDGMEFLNNQYDLIRNNRGKNALTENIRFDVKEKEDLKNLFAELDFIKDLGKVSQIGLKGFWRNESDNEINNNRWEHSKYVADLALKYYTAMQEKSGKEPNTQEKVLVYVSGLLHDCGHLPFSHLLEEVFSELSWKFENNEESFRHDHYTSYLIRNLFDLGSPDTSVEQNERSKIRANIKYDYGIDYNDIIKVIEGNYGVGYIDALINSEIDCDKIAYLCRDSMDTNVKLIIEPDTFLETVKNNAHITQEKFIALDSESAWIAFKLLDERKRLYNELYFASDLRFREAAVKFILTIYFVQQYNKLDEKDYEKYIKEEYGDLSHCRIKMAIEDLFGIINSDGNSPSNIKNSLGEQTQKALEKCMEICMRPIGKPEKNTEPEKNAEIKPLAEIKILKVIYKRLTGEEYAEKQDAGNRTNYLPYHDKDIDGLSEKLGIKQLRRIRKRIHLNFPGILLIDVFESVRYLSTAKSRKKQLRIDGTEESQTIYLVPSGDRDAWVNNRATADIDISDYVKEHKLDVSKCTFNVYKLSDDNASVENAINMLKKEMKIHSDNGSEEDDE
jgi:hypothetical protein